MSFSSVYADDIDTYYTIPLCSRDASDISSNGLHLRVDGEYYYYGANDIVYMVNAKINNSANYYLISDKTFTVYRLYAPSYIADLLSSPTGDYFYSQLNSNNVVPSLPVYNDTSYSTLVEFIESFLSDVSGPTVQGYTQLVNGNIVYFDLGNNKGYNIDINSYFYSKSGTITGTWDNDNRRYGFTDSLPAVDTSFDETSGAHVPFVKSSNGQDLLGRTNYGIANISGTTTGRFLWVINPMYNENYFQDSLSGDSINGSMTIHGVPSGTPVYTYSLKQDASSIGLVSVVSSTVGGYGTVSTQSNQQTTFVNTEDNTQAYTQTVGGDNSPPEEVGAVEGIRQTLEQFVNSFRNLFLAPVEYIQNLISSGSSFMQTLGGIFTWLPEPVVSVFLSALVLMIVIGVIKMLL